MATDVNARALHFARFNARLNGLDVEVLESDVYSALSGRRFDRIVAHPPYVPTTGEAATLRDGGSTGEELLREMVQGLPGRLAPGGLALFVATAADTDEPFELRVRCWLGAGRDAFDVVIAAEESCLPHVVLGSLRRREPPVPLEEIAAVERRLLDAGFRSLAPGALVVRRRENGDAWTSRPRLTDATVGADIERAFVWHDWRSRPEAPADFVEARPRLAPWLRASVEHVVTDGKLRPARVRLQVSRPFGFEILIEPQLLAALQSCDASTSVAELHEREQREGRVPAEVDLRAFGATLAVLVDRGILIVDLPGETVPGSSPSGKSPMAR